MAQYPKTMKKYYVRYTYAFLCKTGIIKEV